MSILLWFADICFPETIWLRKTFIQQNTFIRTVPTLMGVSSWLGSVLIVGITQAWIKPTPNHAPRKILGRRQVGIQFIICSPSLPHEESMNHIVNSVMCSMFRAHSGVKGNDIKYVMYMENEEKGFPCPMQGIGSKNNKCYNKYKSKSWKK